MKRILLLHIGMIYIAANTYCQSSRLPLEKLDSFISKTMQDWHLMGLALAVVKKDTVIVAKGYGYRDYDKKLPVTKNTVFPVASCSKTFTAALMGMAEKDGIIKLSEPVHQYFPEFQLYTDELTRTVTAEDMLSHRTGSAGHDWAWAFNTNFPEDVYLKRIKYQETFAPLRTEFQYSNFMFFALSTLSGKLYNTNWHDLVTKKIFQPLEMQHTYSSYISRNHFYPDTAMTYEFHDSFLLKKTNQMDDLLGAGSINSTADDLAHWLQMWISGGKYNDQQLLSPGFVKRSFESHFIVDGGTNEQYPDEHFRNVGYSWFLSSYRGHYKAHHTGNIDGFSSSITFFPFDSLGIVVLANQNNSMLIRLIPDFIADLAFQLPVRDKNSFLLERRKKFATEPQRLVNIDTVSIQPQFSLDKYTGSFYNPGYGDLKIETFKKTLKLTYYSLELILIPKGGHRFFSHYNWEEGVAPDGVGEVLFHFDNKGMLQSLQVPFEPAVKDIVFQKK